MSFYGQQIIQHTNEAPSIQGGNEWIEVTSDGTQSHSQTISHKAIMKETSIELLTIQGDKLYKVTIKIDEAGHVSSIETETNPLDFSGFTFSDTDSGNIKVNYT